MFAMIGGIFRLFGLLLLSVLLASCGGGGGGDDGGFTPERINVTVSADKTSLPVNLAAESPNPNRPYTTTITARVTKSGNPFPTTITIADSSADAGLGSLFNLDNTTDGFQRIVLEDTDGIGQVFFHAGTKPGTVTITASAQDPNTGEAISASVNITIIAEERPATTVSFTGPYVNAVLAGQSRFGDPPLQNGAYNRAISVVVNDANGNPTNPNTKINFFLVDAPITGYPANPGAFFIAGNDGDPVEGKYQFSAASGDFQRKGVQVFNRLVLDGRTTLSPTPDNRYETGIWQVQDVLSATSLTIRQDGRPFNTSVNDINNGATVPYLIGYAENGAVLSPAYTNVAGVADTILTYPANRIGQTAVLVACAEDDAGKITTCGILNTCAANGTGCKSVYLDVTNGSDRTLTVSTTSLGPNRSTEVRMCLRDVNFTPLPATEIRYTIGSAGPATVRVNGVANTTTNKGAFFTGSDGCAVATIASSGQIPGSSPIELQFTSDFVAVPATITIQSPGAGQLDGLFNCKYNFEKATAECAGTLRLTDDEGTPMAGVLIAVGDIVLPEAGLYTLAFNPAEGTFGKTNDQGEVGVTISLNGPGVYTFPFQTAAGGTAKYVYTVNVPLPGTLEVSLVGSTEAEIGKPYSAVLQALGGVPPYTWTLLSGSLPPGLSLSANGSISGTPTTAGTFSFAVQVTDSRKLTGFGAFTITVGDLEALEVEVTPLTGTVSVPFSGVASATGGKAPYTFSLLAGSLPSGVALSSNGTLSGTPNQVGAFAFSIQAKDSQGATGTGNFTITISSASPVTVTLSGPTTAAVGATYSGVLTATGGTPPYTFAITAGSLPDGVTLNSATGALSGKPTKAGAFTFTAQATDSKGVKGTATVTITVTAATALTLNLVGPESAEIGKPYSAVLTATGGTAPYTFVQTAGSLPPGIGSVQSNGTISGTPTTAGSYSFAVQAKDSAGATGLGAFTIVVSTTGGGGTPLTVAFNPDPPPAGTVNVAYNALISASGGTAPYSFKILAGSLPTQLKLSADGSITGVPDVAGTFPFSVQATDSAGASGTGTFTITIASGGGGGGSAGNPEALGLATTQTSVKSNNSDSATITATVLDGSNVGISGKTVTFSATGGQLSASAVVTDKDGNAPVEFRAGTVNNANQVVNITATVTRTATATNPVTTLSKVIPIQIGGTNLQMTATKTSLRSNGSVNITDDVAQVTVTLLDSGNLPIFDSPVCLVQTRRASEPLAIPGSLAYYDLQKTAITSPSCSITGITGAGVQVGKTDVNGKLTFQVVGLTDGNLTLNASASGAGASQDFTVQPAGQVFKITAPSVVPPATTIPPQITWKVAEGTGGVFTVTVSDPRAGATKVRFTTSLGFWAVSGGPIDPDSGTVVDVDLVNGQASAQLRSINAGLANVEVSDLGVTPPLTDNIQLQFTADICDATKLILDAAPRVVPISTGGVQNVANLVATLLTGLDQPVAGAVVSFSLQSSTGGGEYISPPTAVTVATGEAKTTFISGARASAAEGIIVSAKVTKPTTCGGDDLTNLPELRVVITDKAGSVVIGASTKVESINQDTAYSLPMSVLVADVNGNPVRNTDVSLSAWPSQYSTGIRAGVFGGTFDTDNPSLAVITDTFANEDVNENTICDQPGTNPPATSSVCPSPGAGEDLNADGVLTPANTAAGNLPLKATTDQNGLATFNLVYLKQYANWIVDRIRASALVAGTQIVSELSLPLAPSVDDGTANPPVLSDSPYNAVCPFKVTLVSVDPADQVISTGLTAGLPTTMTVNLQINESRQTGFTNLDRPVTALVDNRNITGARVNASGGSFGNAFVCTPPATPPAARCATFKSTVTATQAGSTLEKIGGTAVLRYLGSCAPPVDISITVKP